MRPRAWIWDFSSTHSLTRALSSEPALQAGPVAALAVAPVGRELASQDVAEAISDLPAGDVVDVVLGGWRGQHDIETRRYGRCRIPATASSSDSQSA